MKVKTLRVQAFYKKIKNNKKFTKNIKKCKLLKINILDRKFLYRKIKKMLNIFIILKKNIKNLQVSIK
jgi:hypothetical protein